MAGRFVQKVWPYLDDQKLTVKSGGKLLYNWCGWCLAVADASFGVAPFAASAQVAWNVNTTKHTDRDIPQNVYVPIFWTGDRQGYGHVAIAYREGDNLKVWSSPYTNKPYFDYFAGNINSVIETIRAKYGLTSFLGWTETLGDKRIVAWENIPEAVVVPEPTPAPEPQPEPQPEPTPEPEPEPTPEPMPEVEEPVPPKLEDTPEPILDEDFENVGEDQFKEMLEKNVKYMENIMETIETAGAEINFSATTKKVVYIIGDVLLLAGAEVSPIITMLNTNDPTLFGTALTQALTLAGIGILVMFKLLKAKAGKKLVG